MNDPNLEYALIGNLFERAMDRRTTLELIWKSNFKPEYITQNELRTAYNLLVAEKSDDRTILIGELRKKLSCATIEKCISNSSVSPNDVIRVFNAVKEAGDRKTLYDIISNCSKSQGASSGIVAVDIARQLNDFARSVLSTSASGGIALSDLTDAKAEEDDPDCLFRGRFLTKGSALVLASVSGAGKSVITLQLAYAWALGRSMFGIEPLKPLKIGIFQTEDDDQEMAGFRSSMRQGYERFCGWSAEEIAQAERNIRLFPMDGEVGDEFISYFRRVQFKERFDLVIINPLQGVTNFDISDNTEMRKFVRQKLDGVIKLVDAEDKCGLLIVHHTNKPPAANLRGGFGTDQYAQYVGAGASELTNWMRAMLAIMPDAKVPGQYKLVAAKRGKRLGWPNLPEPTANPTKLIRHSTPDEHVLFWHEVGEGGTASDGDKSKDAPSVTKDAARLAAVLQADAMTLTEARKFAESKEMFGRKRGDSAYEELTANLSKYNVEIRPTGTANKSVIGSAESVKNWFYTERVKLASATRLKLAKMEMKM